MMPHQMLKMNPSGLRCPECGSYHACLHSGVCWNCFDVEAYMNKIGRTSRKAGKRYKEVVKFNGGEG